MKSNHRETGARKLQPTRRVPETDQNAGMPKKPRPYGLTEAVHYVNEKTRHSDGMNTSNKNRP